MLGLGRSWESRIHTFFRVFGLQLGPSFSRAFDGPFEILTAALLDGASLMLMAENTAIHS
jgi:hypothetical protein